MTSDRPINERMARLEERVANIDEKVGTLDKKIDSVELRIIAHFDRTIEAFNRTICEERENHKQSIAEVNENKANKWVERAIIIVGSSVILAVVAAVMNTILK